MPIRWDATKVPKEDWKYLSNRIIGGGTAFGMLMEIAFPCARDKGASTSEGLTRENIDEITECLCKDHVIIPKINKPVDKDNPEMGAYVYRPDDEGYCGAIKFMLEHGIGFNIWRE